jgi:DNA-binding GntR family transcriptional regulator
LAIYVALEHDPKLEQLSDQIARDLRKKIVTGRLPQGAQISIRDVAHSAGVSFIPARDAVKSLAREGLVTVRPRAGAFVTRLTPKDIREIYEVRLFLEPQVAGQTVERVTPAWIKRAWEIYELSAMVPLEAVYNDYETFQRNMDLDSALHRHFISLADNDKLMTIYDDLNTHWRLSRILFRMDPRKNPTPRQEHKVIIEAYEARDAKAAAEAIREHISNALRVHLEQLKEKE